MVSIAEQPFNMLHRHPSVAEAEDSALYPNPPEGPFPPTSMEFPLDAYAEFSRPLQQQQHQHQQQQQQQDIFQPAYHSMFQWSLDAQLGGGRSSPNAASPDDGDMQIPPSNHSTDSVPSAASSPLSHPGHPEPVGAADWSAPHSVQGLGVGPGIVGPDYFTGGEYAYSRSIDNFVDTTFDLSGHLNAVVAAAKPPGFVDPSLIHPEIGRPMAVPTFENPYPQNPGYPPPSPALSASPQPPAGSQSPYAANGNQSPYAANGNQSPYAANGNQSPYAANGNQSPYAANGNGGYAPRFSPFQPPPMDPTRRQSVASFPESTMSHEPHSYSGDESKEKQRCPHQDCGKTFKDLKAHMLTHQTERPEKCPIQTCDYHIKGFARKYDKNRHTLTHYKGTMVCGFCPGSGSAAEKSFNRADVFKRHLTAVHNVEQTAPNSRKKSLAALGNGGCGKKQPTGYAPDATGKCSTCSSTFANAQDFYEHLDDCVLRIVQQEDPGEAINAQRLAEVEDDKDVHETLEKNQLPTTTQAAPTAEEDDDDDEDDDMVLMGEDEDSVAAALNAKARTKSLSLSARRQQHKGNPANGVQKSRGMTHSRGGVPLPAKGRGRKSRSNYPSSWGFDKGQMTMKKRVMAVFDGPRRLAKDDMMLSTEHEVRVKLSDGRSYVTDLDVQTMRRAEGFHSATDEERGVWVSDDPTAADVERMLGLQQ